MQPSINLGCLFSGAELQIDGTCRISNQDLVTKILDACPDCSFDRTVFMKENRSQLSTRRLRTSFWFPRPVWRVGTERQTWWSIGAQHASNLPMFVLHTKLSAHISL